MKKIYFIFVILISLLSISNVKAECTADEIKELKNEVNKIKVTYKHLGAVENSEDEIEYDHFNLTFKNISEDFVIQTDTGFKWDNNDGIVNFDWISGNSNFQVFSKKCNTQIGDIAVFIPYFNEYSLDPLCEGIDGEEFDLCSKYKYTTYTVSYDTFKKKVEEYKKGNTKNEDSNEVKKFNIDFKKIIDLISEYKIYIICFIGTIIMICVLWLFFKKKKKRGVLK